MEEHRSLLAWAREALPWLALGAAGGLLAILASEEKLMLRAGLRSLLRSMLAAVAAGAVLTARGSDDGDILLIVLVAGLAADFAIAMIRQFLRGLLNAVLARISSRWGGEKE